jgi:hypothetical protein
VSLLLYQAAVGVVVKHLILVAVATVPVFSSLACNQAKFQSEPQPSAQTPEDPALDVSERGDQSNQGVNGNQANSQAPIVNWPAGTQQNPRGPVVPLPGSPDRGTPADPSLPPIANVAYPSNSPGGNPGVPSGSPGSNSGMPQPNGNDPGFNGSNPNDPLAQTPGSQIPGMPQPNGNDPGFNGFPGGPNGNNPIPEAPNKTPVPGVLVPEGRRIELASPNCSKTNGANLPVFIDVDAPRNHRVEATISGEFCPRSNRLVNILFVVDFSASMGRHQPETDGPVQDGNDPLINGACGRLAATQAIVAKMKALAKPGDLIRVGMIPFAGDVVRSFIIPGTEISNFERNLTSERFCRYVLQGEQYRTPGALTRSEASGADSSTNYQAAFAMATQTMKSAQGRNLIYFITDGEPTTPKPNPVQAATAAAEQLRRTIPNLTFNGIILGSQRPAAEEVLKVVTGSPERVRYAAEAEALATEITQFADARIDVNHPQNSGWVFVDPYPVAKLGLYNLVEASPNFYTYKTMPLVLLGIPGQVIQNRVVVEARGFDGSTHRSIVIIRYRQL